MIDPTGIFVPFACVIGLTVIIGFSHYRMTWIDVVAKYFKRKRETRGYQTALVIKHKNLTWTYSEDTLQAPLHQFAHAENSPVVRNDFVVPSKTTGEFREGIRHQLHNREDATSMHSWNSRRNGSSRYCWTFKFLHACENLASPTTKSGHGPKTWLRARNAKPSNRIVTPTGRERCTLA